MIRALLRAFGDLFAPPLRRVVGLALAIATASFAGLWLGLAIVLDRFARFGWDPFYWASQVVGALAVAGLSWLFFPAVATVVMGLFIDRVAGAVETLDYPGKPPPRHSSLGETMVVTLRLMGLSIVLNLLALPVYVLLPGLNFFVFLGLNGYLFGREYFEVVALRRLEQGAARSTRKRFAGRVFVGGVVIAGLFAVPFVNLVTPVVATAFMVHLFERLTAADRQLPAS